MKIQGVRSEVLNDKEIYKLLIKKNEYITQLQTMQDEINTIAAEGKKIQLKLEKLKGKYIPKIEKKTQRIELDKNLKYNCPNCKWEVITVVDIEGDEVVATITDAIDTEKQRILTKVEEEKEKDESKSSATDKG
jgi:cobalamin biosynthesis protein CbiG